MASAFSYWNQMRVSLSSYGSFDTLCPSQLYTFMPGRTASITTGEGGWGVGGGAKDGGKRNSTFPLSHQGLSTLPKAQLHSQLGVPPSCSTLYPLVGFEISPTPCERKCFYTHYLADKALRLKDGHLAPCNTE